MDIHTRQLRYFMELAKCLNFTKAAMNLYVAQPALSQQIADLEKQLGVTLFERNSRTVSLTHAGKILQNACPEILNKLEDVRQQMLWAQAGLRGSIRIGYLDVFQTMLPAVVQEFRKLYPDVALEFYNSNLKELKQALENSVVDVAFAFIDYKLLPQDNTPHYNVFWQEDLCVVAHKDHPFVTSGCQDYTLLENDTFIFIDEEVSPGFRPLAQAAFNEVGLRVRFEKRAKRFGSIMMQVEAGLGVSVVPSGVNNGLAYPSSQIAVVPIQKKCMDFGVLWNPDSKNAALPLFLELIENMADAIPGK